MKALVQRALDVVRHRHEDNDDQGFSLIELIVVVAILGILVAIAIPVFSGIQATARTNALKTAAANGATVVATQVAKEVTTVSALTTALNASTNSDYTLSLTAPSSSTAVDLTNFCVTATALTTGALNGATAQTSGPACS